MYPLGSLRGIVYNQAMISEADKVLIQGICRKYSATRVLLFGSSLAKDRASRDIDIAVDGIAPRDWFRFWGELMCALSKPVDVIDLSVRSQFVDLIRREGIVLYG
jgi:predicted nucleotidyltransferase